MAEAWEVGVSGYWWFKWEGFHNALGEALEG